MITGSDSVGVSAVIYCFLCVMFIVMLLLFVYDSFLWLS